MTDLRAGQLWFYSDPVYGDKSIDVILFAGEYAVHYYQMVLVAGHDGLYFLDDGYSIGYRNSAETWISEGKWILVEDVS